MMGINATSQVMGSILESNVLQGPGKDPGSRNLLSHKMQITFSFLLQKPTSKGNLLQRGLAARVRKVVR